MKPIKILLSAFTFCIATAMSQTSIAQATDPLWLKVIERINGMQQSAPKDVEVNMVFNTSALQRQVHIQKQISGWNKRDPIYTNLTVTETPARLGAKKEMKPIDLKGMMDMVNGEIFSPDAKVKRTDNVPLAGKKWTLFELKEGVLKKMAMKIWVDPETTLVCQQEVDAYVPMGFEAKVLTQYDLADGNNNLPLSSQSTGEVLVPFKGVKFSISETFQHWIARPK